MSTLQSRVLNMTTYVKKFNRLGRQTNNEHFPKDGMAVKKKSDLNGLSLWFDYNTKMQ